MSNAAAEINRAGSYTACVPDESLDPETPIQSFPPIARADARVLILGSMPSVTSLRKTEYYGHPQNLFWDFMADLFDVDRDQDYAARVEGIQTAGVAVWDVAYSCRRELSADATMRDVEPNDIAGLIQRCPIIRVMFCNGRKAQTLFDRLVRPQSGDRLPPSLYLPSTSPANAATPRSAKREAWQKVKDWAAPDYPPAPD